MATRVSKKPIKKNLAKKTSAAKSPRKKTVLKKANDTKRITAKSLVSRSPQAAKPSGGSVAKARAVEQYDHPTKKRLNNPPVGLVTAETDPDLSPKIYAYDPHLDPQLMWTGKEEKLDLTVDTVSLHVHERIDPYTIIDSIRNKESFVEQPSLFSKPTENPPLREAVDFYKHQHNWSNRLIAGDSLLVMNSLLEREGMAGQVQMIYIDPPYGIKYRSNFQPFTSTHDVSDADKDDDLTREPEMIHAFRDTWELEIHSYLTYLRDRVILSRALLTDSGSCFVQISSENCHLVRSLLDEVFEADNFVAQISVRKSGMMMGALLKDAAYYVLWYAKDKSKIKYRQLYLSKRSGVGAGSMYSTIESPDGKQTRKMTEDEIAGLVSIPQGWRAFRLMTLTTGGYRPNTTVDFEFSGHVFHPGADKCWRTTVDGLKRLVNLGRVVATKKSLNYKAYVDDFPAVELSTIWNDTGTGGSENKFYVVQTPLKVIQRCMLMATDVGDLVLDPTCGGGTTAVLAEQWGRRWITCDTSRVAIALSKERLMTASFEYYELQNENTGVDDGMRYNAIPHLTLKSIANDEPAAKEPIYDDPIVNHDKVRITGPFTVEAVPAPMVAEMNTNGGTMTADSSVVRSGPTQRQADWRLGLLKTGARGLGGAVIRFSRVEPIAGTRYIHAEAETAEEKPRHVVISFGPEYQPLEQRQVELAWEEARSLDPRPDIILFAAFQFDPEAAKDIDDMPVAVTKKTTFLRAQMNPDLLTGDLKKKQSSNQSFWLVGRPDVEIMPVKSGADKGKFQVVVHGFDYYDVKSGQIESGGAGLIAMWMLDPDYDGRSVFPRQVFFPNAGDKNGWNRLSHTLRTELDEELLEAYLGTESLPFAAGTHNRLAVKIIDNRGIESLRVLDLP